MLFFKNILSHLLSIIPTKSLGHFRGSFSRSPLATVEDTTNVFPIFVEDPAAHR